MRKYCIFSVLLILSISCTHRGDDPQKAGVNAPSSSDPVNINSDFMVLKEGAYCGELNIDPDLQWYGVYNTGIPGTTELKKTEIVLIMKSNLNEVDAKEVFGEDGLNADYLVGTCSDVSSVFLVGSKEPLEEIRISSKNFEETCTSGFLYPEQKESIFIPGFDELLIIARENFNVPDSSICSIERNYEIEISNYNQGNRTRTSQNITKDIPYTGSPASLHASHQTPRIIWCGDIDNDHTFDLLIYSDQIRESGDNMGYLVLFLSSKADPGLVMKKVTEWAFMVSCGG
jgi:hypothetical protein